MARKGVPSQFPNRLVIKLINDKLKLDFPTRHSGELDVQLNASKEIIIVYLPAPVLLNECIINSHF